MPHAKDSLQGHPAYVLSMGLATLTLSGIPVAFESLISKQPLGLQASYAAVPGIFSGMIWNLANVSSIIATRRIGLSLAYPIF